MFRRRGTAVQEADADVVHQETTVRRGTDWTPAQIVALVIGGAAIVFGSVALVRTGFNVEQWFSPEREVMGFDHTPLLAVSEIGFGILMLLCALSPAGRALMALLSAVLLAFGIVIVAEGWQARLHDWFGVTDRNGWLFIVVGAFGLLCAVMLPTVHGRDRVTHRRGIGRPHPVH